MAVLVIATLSGCADGENDENGAANDRSGDDETGDPEEGDRVAIGLLAVVVTLYVVTLFQTNAFTAEDAEIADQFSPAVRWTIDRSRR